MLVRNTVLSTYGEQRTKLVDDIRSQGGMISCWAKAVHEVVLGGNEVHLMKPAVAYIGIKRDFIPWRRSLFSWAIGWE
ncbi:hypothetical protein CYMTET_50992 [Cymbomonas tetramitiformis]|uniref:Uncharacterized protein n=1 Tax=Cymbomonas tetramitiformis TaxID=36881 RepID=A0AAE0BLY8_9CHLO|nr:hypothetical protein CYMTET_50992 [Cymbomonas tetramitiformis]